MFLFPIISENTFYILIHKYHNVNYFIFCLQILSIGLSEGETALSMQREPMLPLHTHFLERLGYPRGKPLLEKIGYPPRTPPSRKPQILGVLGYPREKPLLEKIGCPPRTPLSRKSLLYIFLFYPLIQVYTDNKVIDKDENPYNSPFSKNAKRKSGYIKI